MKLSGTGHAAAHNVSTLAIRALYIIELPGPYESLIFSFRNAFAIIVPGKWTVAFDSTFRSSNVDSLRCGEDRLRRRGEYLSGYGPLSLLPSGISTITNTRILFFGEPVGCSGNIWTFVCFLECFPLCPHVETWEQNCLRKNVHNKFRNIFFSHVSVILWWIKSKCFLVRRWISVKQEQWIAY